MSSSDYSTGPLPLTRTATFVAIPSEYQNHSNIWRFPTELQLYVA